MGRRAGNGARSLRDRTARVAIPLTGLALAALAALPWQTGWLATTAMVVALGVPHGALDGEVARPVLRPRFGRAWFLVFALPYLSLSAAVLIAWRLSPLGMLAAFLAMSVWHFGAEDAPPGRWVEMLVRGGMPIALPLLIHPAATTAVFAAAAQAPLPVPPAWLWAAALAWAAAASGWAVISAARGHWRRLPPVALPATLFGILPPLTAFAIYFVCVHAPAHTRSLIAHPTRAPRVRTLGSAIRLSLPLTLLTVAIGAALWPLVQGVPAVHTLGLTLQVLSALTLPHMLLDAAMTRRERRALAGNGVETQGSVMVHNLTSRASTTQAWHRAGSKPRTRHA